MANPTTNQLLMIGLVLLTTIGVVVIILQKIGEIITMTQIGLAGISISAVICIIGFAIRKKDKRLA